MDEWDDSQVARHAAVKKLIELEYKKLLSSGVNPDHNNFFSGFEKGYIKGIAKGMEAGNILFPSAVTPNDEVRR